MLFTGKDSDYSDEDLPDFIAERNAKLKQFPHKSTRLKHLIQNIDKFGFRVKNCFIARRRGDLGAQKISKINLAQNNEEHEKFYEFVVILEKSIAVTKHVDIVFTQEYSQVAIRKAKDNGSRNVFDYFKLTKKEN